MKREESQLDRVFLALAHAGRRQMLDIIKDLPGCSVNDVVKYFDMSRIGVMKHLRLLEEAGLVVSRKTGRVRELYFNAGPIQLIHDRWSTDYGSFWASKAMDLKYQVEGTKQ